jgi:tetratricopeptide (TPR) repeat protein
MPPADDTLAPDTSKVSLDQRVIVPAFGLGRWAPFNWERLPHSTGIRPFWGRITAWLLVLACVGWLLLASAAYGFVKYRRGFTDVSFHHMVLLPWKLDDYRRAKGEFLIREGLALAEKQEWRPAFDLLRTGLAAVPDHREARLMTARIYLMAGRPDMVRTLLIEGLAYHADQLDYLRQLLGFFFGLQADDTVVELTGELRARLGAESPARRMAVTALAYAYFNRDRLDEAVELLREERLLGTPEGRFVLARVEWERGRKEEAIAQLRDLTAQVTTDDEIYRTLVYYLKEQQRWAEVRRAALSRQFALPERPEAYVDFIAACAAQGDEAARVAAEEGFFATFADNAAALLKLGEEAARGGRLDVVERVLARCRALGREPADAMMLLLLAHLERREYEAVLSAVAQWSAETAQWPERQRLVLGGLKAAALYGRGEEVEAEPLVRRLCETRLLPAAVFTVLAEQLENAGQGEQARRVLRHAVEVDPLNQPALVMLLRSATAARELGGAVEWIERLLAMRKPPAAVLRGLERELGSDRYLLLPGRVAVQAKIAARLTAGAE